MVSRSEEEEYRYLFFYMYSVLKLRQHNGLMVSALDSISSGQGHYIVVVSGKTLYSRNASLHPGVRMSASE